jgi:hypothetical protein
MEVQSTPDITGSQPPATGTQVLTEAPALMKVSSDNVAPAKQQQTPPEPKIEHKSTRR